MNTGSVTEMAIIERQRRRGNISDKSFKKKGEPDDFDQGPSASNPGAGVLYGTSDARLQAEEDFYFENYDDLDEA